MRLKRLGKFEIFYDLIGDRTATFRLAAQCLNQLRYRVLILQPTQVFRITPFSKKQNKTRKHRCAVSTGIGSSKCIQRFPKVCSLNATTHILSSNLSKGIG
jgi:hypothetical protein